MKNIFIKINNENIKKITSIFLVVSIFISPFSSLLFYKKAEAVFNKEINYQGKLTTSASVAVPNGSYNMEFKLYTISTGGSAIWTETRINSNRVAVANGLFSVMLGEIQSLAGVDFNQTLYLGVNIGGTNVTPSWDGEMTPRKKIGAVPAAIEAENAAKASSLVGGNSTTLLGSMPYQSATDTTSMVAPNTTTTRKFLRMAGTGTNGAAPIWDTLTSADVGITNPVTGTGTTNYLTKFTGTSTVGDSLIFDNGTNVGIGTTNPVAKLDVSGGNLRVLNYSVPASGAGLEFGYSAGMGYIYSYDRSASQYKSIDFNDAVYVTGGSSSGKVGIGTTNPKTKLQISGDNTGVTSRGTFSLVKNEEDYGLFAGVSGTGDTWMQTRIGGSSTYYNLLLNPNGGSVGIGTTAPAAKLDVLGTQTSLTDSAVRRGIISIKDDTAFAQDVGPAISFSGKIDTAGSVYYQFGAIKAGKSVATESWADGYLSFLTSSNTGILSEKMRITSGGNVGIGTTGPGAKLEVVGDILLPTTANIQFGTAWNTGTLSFKNGATGAMVIDVPNNKILNNLGKYYTASSTVGQFGTQDNYGLALVTNNTEKVRIDTSGNVGIGTAQPANKLQVKGTGAISSTNAQIKIGDDNGVNAKEFWIGYDTTGDYSYLQSIHQNTGYTALALQPTNGNVGIGTTSPGAKLDVVTTGAGLYVMAANTSPYTQRIAEFRYGGNGNSLIVKALSGTAGITTSAGSDLKLSTEEGNPQMVLATTGNVGIGTTSPTEAKLEIAGTSGELLKSGTLTNDGGWNHAFGATDGNGIFLSKINAANNTAANKVAGLTRSDTEGGRLILYDLTGNVDVSLKGNGDSYINGGNVGIGTTAPSGLLHVYSTTADSIIRAGTTATASEAGLYLAGASNLYIDSFGSTATGTNFGINRASNKFITNDGGILVIGPTANTALVFGTNNLERMRIQNDGNVGIGTTNPQGKLQVSSDGAGSAVRGLILQNSDAALRLTDTVYQDFVSGNSETSHIRGRILAGGEGDYSGVSGYMSFYSQDSAGTAQERMRINSLGNVGIGTTNPSSKLDVYKDTYEWFKVDFPQQYVSSLNFGVGGTISENDNGGYLTIRQNYNTAGTRIAFNFGDTEVMRLTQPGNVGIGTTSPTAALHLKAGTATASTAPLKFTAGTSLTTPEAGTIEFDGTDLFFTPSTTRETIAFMSDITAAAHNPVTLGAIGSTPNANGMTITTQVLNLEPASASYGGVVTTGTQTFAGAKTFNTLLTATAGATISGAAINLNASSNFAVNIGTGTSTGAVSIGGGSNTFAINSTAFDVSTAGALSGITTLGMSGQLTSTLAIGTAPFAVTSTTVNTNLNADLLDGITSTGFPRALGSSSFTSSTTTTAFIADLTSKGAFAHPSSTIKGTWDYAGNNDISDTGFGAFELAGTSLQTWTDGTTKTVLAIRPTTGSGANQVLIYNDQGSGYSPGWRQIWTSATDGASSGLDADLLDGHDTSYFAVAGSGVTSITGTANQITASAPTGAVTLSLPSDLRAPGTFNAVTSIATGAGAGTTRIDASGNLSNIGTITSGLINGQTISSAANFTGSLAVVGAFAANGGITFNSAADTVGAHTLSGTLDANANILTNIGNAGTDFVATTGALTLAGVLTSNGGITNSGAFSSTGGIISLNASSNFAVNIGTGTSTGAVTIGGGSNTFAINSTAFDVSTAGALSGITTLGMSGQLTSTLAIGTAPFAVTSTTVNTNLNADMLDGLHASSFLTSSTGVTSITGTANQISASAATGSVTLSLPADFRAPGTFNAVTSIATGAGAGTVRISSTGVGSFITGTTIGSQTFTTNNIADSGALTIKSATTNALTLDSGTTGAVNIGNGASAKTITMGNVTGATGLVFNSGTAGATFNLVGAGIAKFQATAVPTTDMVQITNLGQANATAGVNALAVTYVGGAGAIEASAQRIDLTTGATSGSIWSGLRVVGNTAASGVSENAIKVDNITGGAGTESALYVGTGWDNILSYNGTSVINGTGIVQNAAISGAYSGITTLGITGQLTSTLASGTAPFAVTSTTLNTNLNADLLDGRQGTDFAYSGNANNTDVNGITLPSGLYNLEAYLPTGLPSSSSYHYLINLEGYSAGNYGVQLATPYQSDSVPALYLRQAKGSVWQAWSKVWLDTNDGSGSGLDADLLDGHDTAYFQTALTNPVTGTGTNGYNAYWTGANTLGSEQYTAVSRGGTGVGSLNNLITLSTHTTGDYVSTITGSGTITSSGATTGEGIAHTLSVTADSIGDTQLAYNTGQHLTTTSNPTFGTVYSELSGNATSANTLKVISSNSSIDLNGMALGRAYTYSSGGDWVNGPSGMSYGSVYNLGGSNSSSLSVQIAADINHNSTSSTRQLWFRTGNNLGFQNDWKKIWHEGNDGSGSGLDADLLDGHDTAYFQTALTNPVTGTGTNGYNAYWTGANTLGSEQYTAVSRGGTGVGTFTTNGVLYGNGTTSILATAQGAANTVLIANGGAPSFSSAINVGTSISSPIFQGISAATTFGNASYGTTIAGSALTISPTAWTTTPTISGLITATSGLTSNGTLTANGVGIILNKSTGATGLTMSAGYPGNYDGWGLINSSNGPLGINTSPGNANGKDIYFWPNLSAGNPSIYLNGWDAQTSSPKNGRLTINPDGSFSMLAQAGEALSLGDNNTVLLTMSGGNVGIGTISPGTKLDVSGGSIRTDNQLISTVATGTAPLAVSSSTLVSNLNADLLDGLHSESFDQSNTNEIQTLGTSGNNITLTSGGSIVAPYATSAGTTTVLTSKYSYPNSVIDDTTTATSLSEGSLTTVAMHGSHGLFGGWATTLTMSGYDRYGATQISSEYNAVNPKLAVRNYNQASSTWSNWSQIWGSANDGSGSGLDADTVDGLHASSFVSTASGITGSGTANYLPKFTGTQSIGNSLIYDNGTNVGIGTTSPNAKLQVSGNTFVDNSGTYTNNYSWAGGAVQTNSLEIMDRNNGSVSDGVYPTLTFHDFGNGGAQFSMEGSTSILHLGSASSGSAGTLATGSTYFSKLKIWGGLDVTGNITSGGNTVWHAGNDGSGSGLDADLLDGLDSTGFSRSFGGQSFTNSATTADFISELTSKGLFNYPTSTAKGVWDYAGNNDISDTGFGGFELAGTSIQTWSNGSEKTVLAIRPTTGAGGGQILVYNDQGSGYSPGWRQIWTNTTDGVGSGLDADLLDGLSSASFMPAGTDNWVNTTGDTMSGNLNFNNYGLGIVGAYDSTKYQGVFAMDPVYKLPADGSTPGNLYGLAWTHTNVGGQSKAGLGHQLLVMENGVTQTAIGNGIWTRASVTANNYLVDPSNGSGVCFWSDCTNYKVSMGNYAENHYGPVNNYSIKTTMGNNAGWGFTWGAPSATPIAALEVTTGNMQIAGSMTAASFSGNGANLTNVNADRLDGFHIENIMYNHSDRDFANGTLIQTSIDYSNSDGDPWILEIKGNSYGSLIPFDVQYQGYIYANTVINDGGVSNGTNLTGLVVFNYNGKLTFWFPRQTYWQGFNVNVYTAYGTYAYNKVTSISNSDKPGSITKEVELSSKIRQSWHSGNLANPLTGTGTAGYLPKFTGTGTTIGNSLIYDNGTSVGIGTTAPTLNSTKLQINGNLAFSGGQIKIFMVDDIFTNNLRIYGNRNTAGFGGKVELNGGEGNNGDGGNVELNGGIGVGGNGGNIIINSGWSPFGGTDGNIILGDIRGNVGIGTTAPTQKLHVAGAIRATGGYYDSANSIGTNGQCLTSTGSATAWGACDGIQAINIVNTSNLFSHLAGTGVTTSIYSNFFGVDAGRSAEASYSNFIGYAAGQSATSSSNSNFIGSYAGISATNAYGSNFIGDSSGWEASEAHYSNFLGSYSGSSAIYANDSTFIGYGAGFSATNASNSNFLGLRAGSDASSASYSNLFGFKAGRSYTGNNIGSNNIIIGTNISLPNATANAINLGGVLFATGTHATTTGDPSIIPTATGKVGIGTTAPSTIFEIGSSDLGRGVEGPVITLGRNSNASHTGAGSINFMKKSGTAGYVWQDNAGNMRINTSAPADTLDTSGTVIGTQTSTRETKQDIYDYTDYEDALSMIVNAPLHTFRYKNEVAGYGEDSPLAKTRVGFIADEVSAMFMVGNSIDQVSVNGLLMASIRAMNLRIDDLSSLDTSIATSLGSLIKSFLGDINNGVEYLYASVIQSEKVETNMLCVGNVCVTEDQFMEIVTKNVTTNSTSSVSGADQTGQTGEDVTPTPVDGDGSNTGTTTDTTTEENPPVDTNEEENPSTEEIITDTSTDTSSDTTTSAPLEVIEVTTDAPTEGGGTTPTE